MRETQNYGLAGGTLDAAKHVALASDPAAYMARLAERPWMAPMNRFPSQLPRYAAKQSSN